MVHDVVWRYEGRRAHNSGGNAQKDLDESYQRDQVEGTVEEGAWQPGFYVRAREDRVVRWWGGRGA